MTNSRIADARRFCYFNIHALNIHALHAMKYLTKEQQKVLCVILLLLLTGLAVKTWRTAQPPKPAAQGQASVESGK